MNFLRLFDERDLICPSFVPSTFLIFLAVVLETHFAIADECKTLKSYSEEEFRREFKDTGYRYDAVVIGKTLKHADLGVLAGPPSVEQTKRTGEYKPLRVSYTLVKVIRSIKDAEHLVGKNIHVLSVREGETRVKHSPIQFLGDDPHGLYKFYQTHYRLTSPAKATLMRLAPNASELRRLRRYGIDFDFAVLSCDATSFKAGDDFDLKLTK